MFFAHDYTEFYVHVCNSCHHSRSINLA